MAQDRAMFIPPPPLPEFYLPKIAGKGSNRSAALDAEDNHQANNPAEDTEQSVRLFSSEASRAHDECKVVDVSVRHQRSPKSTQPARTMANEQLWFNSQPRNHQDNGPEPLAVFHICRLCQRPRSARYHREHPIPFNGVPPPPGICRRCRLTPIDETSPIVEVVDLVDESEEVKLGVRCLVSDEDYTPHKEAVERGYVRPSVCDARHPTQRRDITYRHVRVIERSPIRRPKVSAVFQPGTRTGDNHHKDRRTGQKLNIRSSLQVEPPESLTQRQGPGTTDPRAIDSVRTTFTSNEAHSKRGKPSVKASETRVEVKTRRQLDDSEIRQLAREEIERHQEAFLSARPGRTESEIRMIARDEIERYRQAERRIEAHGRAYTHGRMLPVQRHISAVAEVVQPNPPIAAPSESLLITSRRSSRRSPSRRNAEKPASKQSTSNAYIAEETKEVLSSTEKASYPPTGISDVASEKTRWGISVSTRGSHSGPETWDDQPGHPWRASEPSSIDQAAEKTSSIRAEDRTKRASSARYETIEVTDFKRVPEGQHRIAKYGIRGVSSELRPLGSGEDSAWNDEKLGAGQRAGRTKPIQAQANPPHSEATRRDSVVMPTLPTRTTSPREESSRASKSIDSSYIYVERSVKALNKPRGAKSSTRSRGDSYEETEILLRRKTPTKAGTTTASSAGSGRVRFSNRVEVSPTPPGSDASSRQFREVGGNKQNGTRYELSEHNRQTGEHRGRSRSRAGRAETEHEYKEKSRSLRERNEATAARDRTANPTPSHKARRPSASAVAGTHPSAARPLAHAFSESPSREQLRLAAKYPPGFPGPPYHVPEDELSDDLEVQDGSVQDEGDRSQRRSGGYRRSDDRRRND